jgi:hypothetical protein
VPDFKESLHRYLDEVTPRDLPAFDTVRVRARRRSHHHRLVAVAVGVVVLVAGSVTVAATLIDGHRNPPSATATVTGPRSTTTQAPAPLKTGPVPFGRSSASCVAGYSLHTLQARAFAFDGTVVHLESARSHRSSGPSSPLDYVAVRFKVNEWFRGGHAPYVTVSGFPPSTEHTDAEDAPGGANYGVGSRLLVSGEPRWGSKPLNDPMAWACGFTRYFDARTAAAWRHAFSVKGKSTGN